MKLTYKVEKDGYTIFNNGGAWIVQDSYIPYPGATIEESAQNHVNEILKDAAADATQANDFSQLQDDNAFIAETLAIALEEIEQLKGAQ